MELGPEDRPKSTAKLIEEPAGIILDRETFVLDPGIHWPREGPRPEICPEVRGYPGNPD